MPHPRKSKFLAISATILSSFSLANAKELQPITVTDTIIQGNSSTSKPETVETDIANMM